MHARQSVPPTAVRLATAQAGVITRQQADGLGVGHHLITRSLRPGGGWLRMSAGVYFVIGGEPSWDAWAWAGVLMGGDQARLGGLAALHATGIGDPPETIEILVPIDRDAPRRPGPWRFRREQPGVRSARSRGFPPRVELEDALLDVVGAGTPADVAGWLSAGIHSRQTNARRLRLRADGRARLRHRRLVLAILDDLESGAHSVLEMSYLHDVEKAHGLPRAERQVARRNTWADVFYREYRLLVELDGRAGHEGSGRFRDMRRDNRAVTDGLVTLRYGYADVQSEPCAVAAQVAGVLIRRGWPGLPTRCDRCRRAA